MDKTLERRKCEAEAALAEVRQTIKLEWSSGDPEDRELKKTIDTTLNDLKTEIERATSKAQLRSIERRIQQCSSKRAYGLDAPQIQTEADACIREMRTWGVPQGYFDEHLKPLQEAVGAALTEACRPGNTAGCSASMRRAQSTLEEIFDEYAYWDRYTDGYVSHTLWPRVSVLGVLALAALIGALLTGFTSVLPWHSPMLAVFLAGSAGTCVSILLKQEPMAVYGDLVKALIWAAGRLVTGMLATVIGMGLLASGLINVGFSANPTDSSGNLRPVHVIVSACLELGGTKADASKGAADSRPDSGTVDAGVVAADAHQVDAGRLAPAPSIAPPATALPACPNNTCSNAALLLLLGFAILFGFSERAFAGILAQFEDKVGNAPQSNPPPTRTMSREPQRPGSDGEASVATDEQKPAVAPGQPSPSVAPSKQTPSATPGGQKPTVVPVQATAPAQPISPAGAPLSPKPKAAT
jgi:hypothetical protein